MKRPAIAVYILFLSVMLRVLPALSTAATYYETVEIKSIVIAVNVFDSNGYPLLYLKKKDFSLFENQVEQEIDFFVRNDKTPVKMIFLLDASGSMGLGDKMRFSKRAIETAVSLLRKGDTYELYTFTEKNILRVIEETSEKNNIEQILDSINAWGKTAIFDSLDKITDIISMDRDSGKIALVLFTDGIDNSSTLNKKEVLNKFRSVAVPMYIIAFDTFASRRSSQHFVDAGLSNKILEYFSAQTGGNAYILEDPVKAPGIILRIYKTVRNQYLLGYTSRNKFEDGEYVRINLIVNKKNTTIKVRKGFIN